ncbi:MAG: ribonuclease R [Candidatus Eutrophobiaceae bacterium]
MTMKNNYIEGSVIAHPDGYGFLKPDTLSKRDIFLPFIQMRTLLHGDRACVQVEREGRNGRKIGHLVKVLERNTHTLAGRYRKQGKGGVVVPDKRCMHLEVHIPKGAGLPAREGQYVLARITQHPEGNTPLTGKVVEIIGDELNPAMCVELAIRERDLPHAFPEEVTAELAKIPHRIDATTLAEREDLRSLPFVTIDGESARDFDDAVYCEQRGSGWRLYVAIADVSHYVPSESSLDRAAYQRGTSVYFPERVIPMLPSLLSDDLCSLRPREDRLAMTCVMDFNADGEKQSHRFCRAVIHSQARLSYHDVNDVVYARDPQARAKHAQLLEPLDRLRELHRLLRKQRERHALIEFSSMEVIFEFDEHGHIAKLYPSRRIEAHCLIEEFMLAANISAGEFLQGKKIPTLFRIHPKPEEERRTAVRDFLREFSLKLEEDESKEVQTADYARLLKRISDWPQAHLIETVLLRSMAMAIYSMDNIGHFGLGFKVYAHFTSPIRRYPDLLVHRAIKAALDANHAAAPSASFLSAAQDHCSSTERRAEEACRDATRQMKCLYLKKHVGQRFHGRISSVTHFGLFVELDDLCIDGLVHISTLRDDRYNFNAVRHCLTGERRGREYRLGNAVWVQVSKVDLEEKKSTFVLSSQQ